MLDRAVGECNGWTERDKQEERERALRDDRLTLDDAIRDRFIAMTTDFRIVWRDPALVRMLAA